MALILAGLTSNSFDGNAYIAMLLATVAAFFMMTGLRRKQRDRQRARAEDIPGPRKPVSIPPDLEQKEKLRRDLECLIGELQDLSRKISAEIDTRFAKLEASIRDADRRIAVLNRLTRELGEKAGEPADGHEENDTRYGVVYELADAGFSCVEIARDLGKTPGEIELILNLRRTARH